MKSRVGLYHYWFWQHAHILDEACSLVTFGLRDEARDLFMASFNLADDMLLLEEMGRDVNQKVLFADILERESYLTCL
jgi:hypothetical protein